jgi:hypothetical protein
LATTTPDPQILAYWRFDQGFSLTPTLTISFSCRASVAEKGCYIKASKLNGVTLLHIAAEADDADFVKYLLTQGFDPSTPASYGPALGATHSEDVAMVLLQAGTDMSKMNESGWSFRFLIPKSAAKSIKKIAAERRANSR